MSERETEASTSELSPEVPPEDALEQQQPATDSEAVDDEVTDTPVEADPADRAEQARVVELDEDEYR